MNRNRNTNGNTNGNTRTRTIARLARAWFPPAPSPTRRIWA